jgi:hypothetical protein
MRRAAATVVKLLQALRNTTHVKTIHINTDGVNASRSTVCLQRLVYDQMVVEFRHRLGRK